VRFCLDEKENSSSEANKENAESENKVKATELNQPENVTVQENKSSNEIILDSKSNKFDLITNSLENKKSLINTLIASKPNFKSKTQESIVNANGIVDEYYSIQDDENKNNTNTEISVLRVFLENQTIKSFKYDKNTCVRDVLSCLKDKLNIKFIEYFGLVIKLNIDNYVSKFIPLDESRPLYKICDVFNDVEETLNETNYQCLFRFMFIPSNYNFLIQNDENSFNYLYEQVRPMLYFYSFIFQ
jgi:hypothetical protein